MGIMTVPSQAQVRSHRPPSLAKRRPPRRPVQMEAQTIIAVLWVPVPVPRRLSTAHVPPPHRLHNDVRPGAGARALLQRAREPSPPRSSTRHSVLAVRGRLHRGVESLRAVTRLAVRLSYGYVRRRYVLMSVFGEVLGWV